MDQLEAIRGATSDDVVEVYCIANRGGYIDTIVPLCNALATTPAHTVCFVEGHCGSAGTFPAMVCDSVEVRGIRIVYVALRSGRNRLWNYG